jgi:hypothetical protein
LMEMWTRAVGPRIVFDILARLQLPPARLVEREVLAAFPIRTDVPELDPEVLFASASQ